ncbi:MAG TPA: glycoside hydrolase family 3 N-terminal domain-containing protein [Gemmatimonadaceae bacterium]|nr:glycoside hydrolase family 3 N-terminal domain-containing protein [Gemmatimonadaceae bacterium]
MTGSSFRARKLAAALGLIVLACARASVETAPSGALRSVVANPPSNAWVDSVMQTLSLRDRVAQLVWPWLLGDYVSEASPQWDRMVRWVTEDHVGGIIISVGSPLEIAAKVNALQRASTLPLLVSADLETGVGFRARGGYFVPNAIDLGGATSFPWLMALGAANDTALAYEMGRVTALEGRALGIHVAYGPVLDVNNNPANPVIGARSFGEDPARVGRLGAAQVRGLQENGMLATGKHFPGHGDTNINSHLDLPVVDVTRARLDSVELVPFRAAVSAGVGAMMTFHGVLPALDTNRVPATLSRSVLEQLLREELKFQGLIVTDAMTMEGVIKQFGAAESNKRAIEAGADVLLMPVDVRAAIDAVVAGVSEGRYNEERINTSVRRVLALKSMFGLRAQRTVDLNRVRGVVGDSTHAALASRIAERGVVLARDSKSNVPIVSANPRPRIYSLTYARRADLGAGVAFDAYLRSRQLSVESDLVISDNAGSGFTLALEKARSADIVMVSNYVNITSETATASVDRAFADFLHQILQERNGTGVVVTTFGTPYLLEQIPEAPTYMIAWGSHAVSQRAAARALLGEIDITATLPISIPPLLKIGDGERRMRLTP